MGLERWMRGSEACPQIEKLHALVDGHRMHYMKIGEGPALLVLHGLLGTAATWIPTLPLLATESTVYAVDMLGMGESERVPSLDAALPAQAERIAAFMQACSIPAADILATSHGGAVAMMLAARHPQRVRTLLLHAPVNPYSRVADPAIQFYRSPAGRSFAQMVPTMPRIMQDLALRRMYGDPALVRADSLEKYVRSLRVPGTVDYVLDILGHWFEDMERLQAVLPSLRELPTLLLWGDRDRAVGLQSAGPLKTAFRKAELVVLPGTGHLPYEECPGSFADAVNAFLRQRDREAVRRPQLVVRQGSAAAAQ